MPNAVATGLHTRYHSSATALRGACLFRAGADLARYGDNRRVGAVKQRSQFQTPSGAWAKRGPDGHIMDVKADDKPFKGVRREH